MAVLWLDHLRVDLCESLVSNLGSGKLEKNESKAAARAGQGGQLFRAQNEVLKRAQSLKQILQSVRANQELSVGQKMSFLGLQMAKI